MVLQHLNYVHVLVATLAYFALGAIWYNPKVFGAMWMKGHNMPTPTAEDRKNMGMMMMFPIVFTILSTLSLACLANLIGSYNWMTGVKLGLAAGAFATTALGMSHAYTKKPFSLTILDSAYHICGLCIAGVILSVWH